MQLTAQDLKAFNIIDDAIPEPLGGAHREEVTAKRIAEYVLKCLETLSPKNPSRLVEERYKRLRKIGSVTQTTP